MKYILCLLIMLFIAATCVYSVSDADEPEVYICDYYDYGYDCILITEDNNIYDI